ncbi:MAG: HYR domain-containing protein, partial [Chitinophagales bacterium]
MKSCLRNQFASVFSSVCNRALLPLLIGILCIGSVQGQTLTIGGFFMQGVAWNPTTRTYTAGLTNATLPASTLTQELANGPVTVQLVTSTSSGLLKVEQDVVTTATNNLTLIGYTVEVGISPNHTGGKIDIGGALTIQAYWTFGMSASINAASVGVYARNSITTNSSLQRIIGTPGNGSITLDADWDANGQGTLNLDYLFIGTGTGPITIRGELLSWNGTAPAISSFGGDFVLESSDGSFGQEVSTAWFNFGSGSNSYNNFRVGKPGNNNNVKYSGTAVNITGSATFHAGAFLGIETTLLTPTVNLHCTGTAYQTAGMTATNLGLHGTGIFTLTNTSNNIGTVAAGESSSRLAELSLVDASGGLTIGTVGSKSGIYSSGAVTVETLTGNLTVQQPVNTTNTGTSALTLNAGKNSAIGTAAGGDILISGSPTFTAGTGGIIKLFSGSSANSTGLSALVGEINVYEGVDETTSSFSPPLSANTPAALYRFGENGDLTVVASGGSALGTGWTYESATRTLRTTVSSAVNVNASVLEAYLATGNLTVLAKNITVDANVTSTTANTLRLNALRAITVNSNKIIQTAGGDIILAASSTGVAAGTLSAILMESGSQLLSGGGDITLGGGYAGTQGNLYAASAISGGSYAIRLTSTTLTAAGGDIKIYGRNVTSRGDGVLLSSVNITTTGSGTIGIYGDSWGGFNNTNYFGGITFENNSSTISTFSGDLTLEGILTNVTNNSSGTGAINFYREGGTGGSAQISLLSNSGTINIKGQGSPTGTSYGIGQSSRGNVYIGSPSDNSWTASGDVVFTISNFVSANSNFTQTKTSGAVSYLPVAGSFTAAFNLPAANRLAVGASSLTIGSATNTANITINEDQTISGPITITGGAVTLNSNLTSTTDGDITIKGTTGFSTIDARRFITTDGGNILVDADADANGSGLLDVDYLTFNPGAGNTTLRAETFLFFTTSNTTKPHINGTGQFILEPSDAAFGQSVLTQWFAIDQDANGIAGVTIGKTTNNQAITHSHVDGLTVNGPVTMYGSSISFTTALSVTNNDLTLQASGTVTQTAAISAAGLSLNGAASVTLTNTGNNIGTLAAGASNARIGALNLVDASGGLTIGTVGSNTGVFSSSTILVETLTGNLTVGANVNTTNTTSSALTLNAGKSSAIGAAAGGDILISGSPAITAGTGGIIKCFSGVESNSTGLSALVGSGNVRDGIDETTTTFNPTLAANTVYAFYRYGASTMGDLTIVNSGGAALGSGWDYDSSTKTLYTTTSSAVNVNASILEGYLATDDLIVRAGSIIFNANVTSGTANNFTVHSSKHITNTTATTITTMGGDVLFGTNLDDATDNDVNENGYFVFKNGLSITTNGGDITIGGGSLGVDYALGTNVDVFTEGLRVDRVLQLLSGGGNISLKGKSFARSSSYIHGAAGIGFYFLTADATINSGTGTILFDGFSQTSGSNHSSGIACFLSETTVRTLTITSANTTEAAITINSKATGTSGDNFGIETETYSGLTILATGGGGINLNTSTQGSYDVVFRGPTNILANSGPINLKGGQLGGLLNRTLFINNDLYLGSKAGTAITASTSDITLQFDQYFFNNNLPYIATTGAFDWKPNSTSFGQTVSTAWFRWGQNGQNLSELTIGKPGNTAYVWHQTNPITVAGPISFYGGGVEIYANLISSANGDLFFKALASSGQTIYVQPGVTISKTAGTGVLTCQGNGRVNNLGSIVATGSGKLDVVLWSDYSNLNAGGVAQVGTIITNGGHVWLGGSSSNGGSYTWNGLTVGDGGSVGAAGSNCHTTDFYAVIQTNGGDVLAWATDQRHGGCGQGIVVYDGSSINTGSGDVTLITNYVSGFTLPITSTGLVTLVPHGGVTYPTTFDWNGTLTSGNFKLSSTFSPLQFNSVANLGGLTIGYYNGFTQGGNPVVMGNSSNITVNGPMEIAGPISLYGTTITTAANLRSSNSDGAINLNGAVVLNTPDQTYTAGSGGIHLSSTLNSNALTSRRSLSAVATGGVVELGGSIGGTVALESFGVTANTLSMPAGSTITVGEDLVLNVDLEGAGNTTIYSGDDQFFNGDVNSQGTLTIETGRIPGIATPTTADRQFSKAYFKGDVSASGAISILAPESIFDASAPQEVSTNGGSLSITGDVQVGTREGALANHLGVNTGGGAVTITGKVNSASERRSQTSIPDILGGYNLNGSTNPGHIPWGTLNGQYWGGGSITKTVDLGTTAKEITFEFYRVDSWDDELFRFYVGGVLIFSQPFRMTTNHVLGTQIYTGTPASGYTVSITAASSNAPVMNNGGFQDQKFIIRVTTPANLGVKTLTWNATLDQSAEDESYYLKHLMVQELPTAVTGNSGIVIQAGAGNVSVTQPMGEVRALGTSVIAGNQLSLAGNIVMAADSSITFDNAATTTYTNIISGTGAKFIKEGAGTLNMNGANTYSGGSTLNEGLVVAGLSNVGNITSGPLGSGTISINTSAALDLDGRAITNNFNLGSTGINSNGGIHSTSTTAVSLPGDITLTGNSSIRSTDGGALTIGGDIDGAFNLEIVTDGTTDVAYTQNGVMGAVTPPTSFSVQTGTAKSYFAAGSTVDGNISIESGQVELYGGLTSSAGDITIDANTGSQLAFNGAGLYLHNNIAVTNTSATGNITVDARGGNNTAGSQCGILMRTGAGFRTDGSGSISLTGRGGGNPAAGNMNQGIFADDAMGTGPSISTEGGDITLTGFGGIGLQNNDGIHIRSLAINAKSGAIVLDGGTTPVGTFSESIGIPANPSYTALFGGPTQTGPITLRGNTFDVGAGGLRSIATTGALTVEPFSTSFDAALTFPLPNMSVSNNLSALTLGKSGNNKDITIAGTATANGPVRVYGKNIAVNGATTANGGTINLHATDAVTQTAPLTASGLGLHGPASFTLTNTSNSVGTVAAGTSTEPVGSVQLTNNAALTVGTVNPTGIFSTGDVLIETLTGNITLSESIETTSGTSNAIILNAGKSKSINDPTGGDILVSGTPTLTMGSGGIAKLMSGKETNSTGLTTLAGGLPQVRYFTDETTTTFTPALSPDNTYALYRVDNCEPFIAGAIETAGETLCYGEAPSEIGSVTLASGGDLTTPTYTWRSSADGYTTAIPGANGASYTPPASLTTTTSYRRYANDLACNPVPSAATGTWTVTINAQFSPGAISTVGESICYGGTASPIGSATAASGGDGNFTYSWRSSANNYATAIPGATFATYTPPVGLTADRTYRRYAKDGTCNTTPEVSTGEWTVTVFPLFVNGAIQTTGETICYSGTPSEIGNLVSSSGGDGNLTYTWRSSVDGFTAAIPGANGETYTPPAGLTATRTYRRYIQDGQCNVVPTASSGDWVVTVRPNFNAGVIATTGQSVCFGITPNTIGSVTAASGGDSNITYTWRSSEDNYATDISGATGATYTPSSVVGIRTFRRYANDGTCNTTPTQSAGEWTLEVYPVPSATITGNNFICEDLSIELNASPTGGTGAYLHNWTQSGTGAVSITNNGTTNIGLGTVTLGALIMTYTVTDFNACTGTATQEIIVKDCENTDFINDRMAGDPCSCNNDQSANGAEDGTFDETVSVVPTFPGETWTVISIAPLKPGGAAPQNIAVGNLMTYNAAAGIHELTFQHVDLSGFQITMEGPNPTVGTVGSPAAGNVQVSISNLCEYPVISFEQALPDFVCYNSTPVTLFVEEARGNPGVGAFVVNGMQTYTFNPSPPLTPQGSPYTILATFTGTRVDSTGGTVVNPAFPGCQSTISDVISIYPTPSITTCPANVTVDDCDDVVPSMTSQIVATSDCDIVSITQNPVAGTNFGQISGDHIIVTFIVSDAYGNSSTCTNTITILDDVAPVFANCPAGITMAATNGLCGTYQTILNPVATDNCSDVTVTLTAGVAHGAMWPVGLTLQSYTATDGAGNTAVCSFVVEVEDTEDPTAVCQNVTAEIGSDGTVTVTAAELNGGSYDNCVGSISFSPVSTVFTCADMGANNVTLVVTDASGNTSLCVSTVTVVDAVGVTIAPVVLAVPTSCFGGSDGSASVS